MSTAENSSPAPKSMSKATILVRLLIFILICGALLFGLAGTLLWTWGWVFLAVFAVVTVISSFAVPLDEELVKERTTVKKGVKQWDKYLAGSTSILFPFGFLIVAALDLRGRISSTPVSSASRPSAATTLSPPARTASSATPVIPA